MLSALKGRQPGRELKRSRFGMVFVRGGADLKCQADLTQELGPAGRRRGEDDEALRGGQVACAPGYFRWGRSVAIAIAR